MAKRRRTSRKKSRRRGSGGGIVGFLTRIGRMAFSIPGVTLLALGAIGIFVVGGKPQAKAQQLASKVNPNAPKVS